MSISFEGYDDKMGILVREVVQRMVETGGRCDDDTLTNDTNDTDKLNDTGHTNSSSSTNLSLGLLHPKYDSAWS